MGPNEKVLRDAYARFSSGDMDHLYEILSDEVVWMSAGDRKALKFPGAWHGKKGVRDYFATSRADWDVTEHNPVEFIAQDDRRFAVRVAVHAKHKRTHKSVTIEKIDLVTMMNGKCVAYAETLDTAPLERASN